MLGRFKKSLRTHQTDAEKQLWYHLRSRRFQGWKFRRQHSFNGYIVDFVCLDRKLIIELDGGQHTSQQTYDAHRTAELEKLGYNVIRFWNDDVMTNMEGVLQIILNTPHPPVSALRAASGDLSLKGRGEY